MSDDEARLAAWVERTVGGRVIDVTRLARWRPAWDLDVEVDGRVLPLHARGEREPSIVMPFRIADEVAAHDLLEAHGLPVPHAYGLCDDPYALVMDRLSGLVDLVGRGRRRRARPCARRVPRGAGAHLRDPASTPRPRPASRCPTDSATTALGGYWRPMEAPLRPAAWRGTRPTRWRCSSGAGCATTCRRTGSPRRASSRTTRSSSCSTTAASPGCSTSSTRTSATR